MDISDTRMLGPYTTYQQIPIIRSSGNQYTYSIIHILHTTFHPQIFSDPVDKRAKTNPLNQALNNQRRLSAAKAIRTGVPCVPVISQCSCSLMVEVYTVSRAVLSAESVATASVPVSDMAHR